MIPWSPFSHALPVFLRCKFATKPRGYQNSLLSNLTFWGSPDVMIIWVHLKSSLLYLETCPNIRYIAYDVCMICSYIYIYHKSNIFQNYVHIIYASGVDCWNLSSFATPRHKKSSLASSGNLSQKWLDTWWLIHSSKTVQTKPIVDGRNPAPPGI